MSGIRAGALDKKPSPNVLAGIKRKFFCSPDFFFELLDLRCSHAKPPHAEVPRKSCLVDVSCKRFSVTNATKWGVQQKFHAKKSEVVGENAVVEKT